MKVFIDSSVWFAALVKRDGSNARAKAVLELARPAVTTDYVVVETWLLLNSRHRPDAADRFWQAIRRGIAELEMVRIEDFEAAWAIKAAFPDQSFSIVDCTSFAVMERLGVTRAASFDQDFIIYRFGRDRDRALNVLR